MVQLVMSQGVLTEAKFLNDEELKFLLVLLEQSKTKPKTKTEYRDSLLLRLALRLSGRSCEILKLRLKDLGKDTVSLSLGAKAMHQHREEILNMKTEIRRISDNLVIISEKKPGSKGGSGNETT